LWTKGTSDEYCPNRPNRSKPALQNAEIAVKMLIQIPSNPNCGTKANASSTMPMASNRNASRMTIFSTSVACE